MKHATVRAYSSERLQQSLNPDTRLSKGLLGRYLDTRSDWTGQRLLLRIASLRSIIVWFILRLRCIHSSWSASASRNSSTSTYPCTTRTSMVPSTFNETVSSAKRDSYVRLQVLRISTISTACISHRSRSRRFDTHLESHRQSPQPKLPCSGDSERRDLRSKGGS